MAFAVNWAHVVGATVWLEVSNRPPTLAGQMAQIAHLADAGDDEMKMSFGPRTLAPWPGVGKFVATSRTPVAKNFATAVEAAAVCLLVVVNLLVMICLLRAMAKSQATDRTGEMHALRRLSAHWRRSSKSGRWRAV